MRTYTLRTPRGPAKPHAAQTVARITARTGVLAREILGRSRSLTATRLRQLAYYLTREASGCSWPEIGRAFGRTHDTCLRGARRFRQALDSEPWARELLDRVTRDA